VVGGEKVRFGETTRVFPLKKMNKMAKKALTTTAPQRYLSSGLPAEPHFLRENES
jgi:hypothetical protein